MVRTKRLLPEKRREELLRAAVDMAKDTHYICVTRKRLARAVGVAPSAVSYYFKNARELRRALFLYALEHEKIEVIAQGFLFVDVEIPDNLREKVKRYLDSCITP